MAVEVTKIQPTYYRGSSIYYLDIKSLQSTSDKLKSTSSKLSQEAAFLKALENKKYWDEILEKLKKSGGGGGSNDRRFDRIVVSMMLTNFLSNKMIQALMRNLKIEFENLIIDIPRLQIKNSNNQLINFVSSVYKFSTLALELIQATLIKFTNINMIQKTMKVFNEFAGLVSFQLNKLEDSIKRLDVKEKIKKIKTKVVDYFIELREEIFDTLDFLKSCLASFIVFACRD